MKAPVLFLHIGLPKTGTTYFQKEVFPDLASTLVYLEKPKRAFLGNHAGSSRSLLDDCFRQSVYLWEATGEEVFRRLFADREREILEAGKNALVSDEGVGTRARKPETLTLHLSGLRKAALRWGFGDVAVVCGFRRQDQWVASHYAQLSDRIPGASQQDFVDFVKGFIDRSRQFWADGIFVDYSVLRRSVAEAVGEKNTHLIPFEELAEDPASCWHRLSGILGTETSAGPSRQREIGGEEQEGRNVRSRGQDAWSLRRTQPRPSLRLRPAPLIAKLGLPPRIPLPDLRRARPESIHLTSALKAEVLAAYEASNRDLARSLRMDLSQYGYY
jgi:hypothetical protein